MQPVKVLGSLLTGAFSSPIRRKKEVFKPSQTRSVHLPPKDPKEEARHLKMYQDLERRFAIKNKEESERVRLKREAREERIRANTKLWLEDILPNWETKWQDKRVRDTWRSGLPPRVRTIVWPRAIGNALGVAPDVFATMSKIARRSSERRKKEETLLAAYEEAAQDVTVDADSDIEGPGGGVGGGGDGGGGGGGGGGVSGEVSGGGGGGGGGGGEAAEAARAQEDMIGLDLPRTFPTLKFFHEKSPQYEQLKEILHAYVCFKPETGYIQGMSYIAGTLLLFLDTQPAFVAFCNIIHQEHLLPFFKMDMPRIDGFLSTFSQLLRETLPEVSANFARIGLTPNLYLFDWVVTLFSRSFDLDVVSTLWDNYFLDGHVFLFRASLAVLHLGRDVFKDGGLEECMARIGQVGAITEEQFFKSVKAIKLKKSKVDSLLAKKIAEEQAKY